AMDAAVEMLLLDAEDAGVPHDSLEDARTTIQTALQSQRGLLNDMLDVALLEADRIVLHPAAADVGALAAKVAGYFAPQFAAQRCALTTESAASVTAVCDAARLERVIHNLLGNALKFTSAYRCDGSGNVAISVAYEGEQVVLRIRDNGPGIAAEDVAR